ncbi:MAG: cell division protein FtsQ/DivIB [Pseudomonadota bacterium]
MSKVKGGPAKRGGARGGRKPAPAPEPTPKTLSERVSTYALGTIIAGASMAALAAWMGGSLNEFDRSVQSGFDTAARTTGLSVRHVLTPGLDPQTKAEVLNAAAVEPGENMFRADPHRIKARVETLQSVGRVGVLRLWPDQIMIIAEPRRPLAVWQTAGAWGVVDEDGATLASKDVSDYADLPKIVGSKGGAAAPTLIAALETRPLIAERLDAALRVGERRWDLKLKSGAELALPEDDRLEEALDALIELHARASVLDLRVARIDARDPDHFALRPAKPMAIASLPVGGA